MKDLDARILAQKIYKRNDNRYNLLRYNPYYSSPYFITNPFAKQAIISRLIIISF